MNAIGSTASEKIYAKLFSMLATRIPAIKTSSRRLRMWDSVASADMPAMFMQQIRIDALVRTGLPTVWTMHVDLFLYSYTAEDSEAPSTALNALVDAVIDTLAPPPGSDEQTLEGLVTRCRVEGTIDIVEGVLGNVAVAILPITILTPQPRG